MSVGKPVTREDLDRQSGQFTSDLDRTFEQIGRLYNWLAMTPNEDLQAPPFNYSASEVAVLKSAIGDLNTLRRVYIGEAAQPEVMDFRRFAKQLAGLGTL